MEKKSDTSKVLAFVLIVLTVLISATSTWLLITSSMDSPVPSVFDKVLISLNIIKNRPAQNVQMDSNAGQATIFIAKSKGG